uniref:Uncharacterized protein n=1 Tax=Knipowitschia caucasica TaxID=637954 RepID=A0AAV2LRF1_KNICA
MRGGVKTRSRRKREPQQNGQKMAETEQGDGAENVSSMLRAIKTDLQEFRVENKNDFRNMKEELRNDMKAELALLKDVVQKRREYGNIKRALKEKSVRFQTPLDKIRIHWDTGARTYGSAREAAIEMRRRGTVVPVPERNPAELSPELERLSQATEWQRTGI